MARRLESVMSDGMDCGVLPRWEVMIKGDRAANNADAMSAAAFLFDALR